MPAELKKRPDLLVGKDKGRIWRIVPEGPRERRGVRGPTSAGPRPPNWSTLLGPSQRLVADDAPSASCWRDDPKTVALLRALAVGRRQRRSPGSMPPGSSMSLGALDDDMILALTRPTIGRPAGERGEDGGVAAGAFARAARATGRALAGRSRRRGPVPGRAEPGCWDDDRIVAPLARIALRAGADDRWTRLAVASGVPGRAGDLIARLAATRRASTWLPVTPGTARPDPRAVGPGRGAARRGRGRRDARSALDVAGPRGVALAARRARRPGRGDGASGHQARRRPQGPPEGWPQHGAHRPRSGRGSTPCSTGPPRSPPIPGGDRRPRRRRTAPHASPLGLGRPGAWPPAGRGRPHKRSGSPPCGRPASHGEPGVGPGSSIDSRA